MIFVEPNVELWKQEDPIAHVARCARVCYRSNKTTGNDKLYNNLIKAGHLSMFRHETVYAIIPVNETSNLWFNVTCNYVECPYIDWRLIDNNFYIVTNGQFYAELSADNPVFAGWIKKFRVDADTFLSNEIAWRDLARYTFHITTQISTSRELNRVSPNNIAEESTRYVLEEGRVCRPWWITKEEAETYNERGITLAARLAARWYMDCLENSFNAYTNLIKAANVKRQEARGVLPLDTATEVVYTYTINEWRHIIDLRYYGTTGKPHENAKLIAGMIKDKLCELGYDFR